MEKISRDELGSAETAGRRAAHWPLHFFPSQSGARRIIFHRFHCPVEIVLVFGKANEFSDENLCGA
jgi:hypothetical protein